MKTSSKIAVVASLMGAVGAGGAIMSGCGGGGTSGATCVAPAMLSSDGSKCLAPGEDGFTKYDLSGDMTGNPSVTCGTNTMLVNGTCVITASACQATGTVYDEASNSCKTPAIGSLIKTLTFGHGFQHIFEPVTDVNNVTTYKPIGGFDAQTLMINNAPVPDTAVIFNKLGVAYGGGIYSARYPVGPLIPTPTVLDPNHKITLGEWKACSGSASWYKPAAKVNGKAVYTHVVDVAGCEPNTLHTVWFFWSPDGTRATSAVSGLAAPSGGIPNALITDDAGAGHWQRNIDSDVWLKYGAPAPFVGTHGPTSFPADPGVSSTTQPGIITVIIYHNNQQTNGNPGFCEPTDPTMAYNASTNPCANPQPTVINLGRSGTDAGHQLITNPGFTLRDLQPY